MTRQLPVLPVRGTMVFPGASVPIYVGRPATIAAIRRARADHGGMIAVFTQVKAEHPGPLGRADLFPVGTQARISACIEMDDGTMKLMVDGEERVSLTALAGGGEGLFAELAAQPEREPQAPIDDERRGEVLAQVRRWLSPRQAAFDEPAEYRELVEAKTLDAFVASLQVLVGTPRLAIKTDRSVSKREVERPEAEREAVNQAMSLRLRALQADGPEARLAQLEAAMAFDLAYRASAG
jgi:ATP-dependent Lon protease